MKKLLLFFMITLLPVLGNAQKLIDGIYYNLNSSDKTAEVTRGDIKYKNSVRIPTTITYNLVTYDVTKIGAFAFDNCKELTGVTIPNSVTSIGRYAFNYCSHIGNISIPDSVTSIGDHAFYECSRLWSINIPQSVTSIGDYAFSGCSNLTRVYITNLEAWCNIQFSNGSSSPLVYAHRLFINNKEVQDLVIPNSVTSIENYAFYGCSGLKSVIIPNSVTSIGFCAFKSCYGLADVITQITEPFPIQEVFRYEPYGEAKNIYDLATLYVPKNTKAKYEAMPGWQEFRKIVEMETNLPTHKLTYVVDGEEYRSYEIEYGAKITPEPTPTKEGYTFSGWSEIPETMPNHDVTVTGTFTKKPIAKYILTYKVDGEVYKTYEIEEGAMITPEPAPTKEGYTFSGWSEIPQTMPNHDVTVTGTFTKKTTAKYKLTYKVDGEIYKTYEIEEGAMITPEPAPTKEGYTFSGWSEIPKTMPAHDVTVTGAFAVNKYNLIYKVDGEVYKSYEVEYGAAITPEPEPTKEGYTFSGWRDIPKTMPAHDVPVTGIFSVNKYKLIYKVDDVEYKSYEIEFGATIIAEPEPTKEGFIFSGWSEIPETMPAHDVMVMGSFTKGTYKLTYMVDDGVYKTLSYNYGDTITPEPNPEKEGYTFSGWSEIPKTMPAHDVTVTGAFAVNKYNLIYKVDGEVYKSYEVEYGAAITPEPEPTKEGYTFSGWRDIPKTMPAHDVPVTGIFSVNKYKLIYKVDDVEYKSYEIEFGATIIAEPEPTKEGFTFSGWSEIPKTMPAHDATVTGTFVINSYKLTYMIDDKVYKETMYEYGATITPELQPEGNYSTFEWTDLPETMPAHDVVVYASYTSGIVELLMTKQQNVRIYSPNGNRLNAPQKGLNIIRMNDGKSKKVIIK